MRRRLTGRFLPGSSTHTSCPMCPGCQIQAVHPRDDVCEQVSAHIGWPLSAGAHALAPRLFPQGLPTRSRRGRRGRELQGEAARPSPACRLSPSGSLEGAATPTAAAPLLPLPRPIHSLPAQLASTLAPPYCPPHSLQTHHGCSLPLRGSAGSRPGGGAAGPSQRSHPAGAQQFQVLSASRAHVITARSPPCAGHSPWRRAAAACCPPDAGGPGGARTRGGSSERCPRALWGGPAASAGGRRGRGPHRSVCILLEGL